VRAIKASDNQVQLMTMGVEAGLPQTPSASALTFMVPRAMYRNASARTAWSILFRRKEHLRVLGRLGRGVRRL
jgi:hypothetical protein